MIDELAADERARASEARDRDERIYADGKAIATSHYQQLMTQISTLRQDVQTNQLGGNPFGFIKSRTFLEVLTALIGTVAYVRK